MNNSLTGPRKYSGRRSSKSNSILSGAPYSLCSPASILINKCRRHFDEELIPRNSVFLHFIIEQHYCSKTLLATRILLHRFIQTCLYSLHKVFHRVTHEKSYSTKTLKEIYDTSFPSNGPVTPGHEKGFFPTDKGLFEAFPSRPRKPGSSGFERFYSGESDKDAGRNLKIGRRRRATLRRT